MNIYQKLSPWTSDSSALMVQSKSVTEYQGVVDRCFLNYHLSHTHTLPTYQLYFEETECPTLCCWCLTFHEATFFRSFWCPSSSADNWSLRMVRAFFVVRPKLEVISSWGARKANWLVLPYVLVRLFPGGWQSTLQGMPCTHHHQSDSAPSWNHLPSCEL